MTDVRAFADRVLRLKAKQDDLSEDIKEVYAEAKASGFDKTIMGQLVAYLRKREKDPHGLEEKSALLDVYLRAYDHGTDLATRAHAHENREVIQGEVSRERYRNADIDPPHDPSTGEILETSAVPSDAAAEQVALMPGGASGSFANTRWRMFSERSCSPAEMKILVPVIE